MMKNRFLGGKYMGTSEMKVILDQDFETLLRKLNVYEDVVAGKVQCEFCRGSVNLSNIAMVFPQNQVVCFCCDKKECKDKLLKRRGISK